MGERLWTLSGAREETQAPPRIEDERRRCVVQRVAVGGRTRHLLVEDLELLRRAGDGRRIAVESDKTRIEGRDILLENLRPVPLRVERHEHHLHALTVGTQLPPHERELRERPWAYVGAAREAEEQHHHLALEVGQRGRLARSVEQFEALPEVGTGDIRGLERGRLGALAARAERCCQQQQEEPAKQDDPTHGFSRYASSDRPAAQRTARKGR